MRNLLLLLACSFPVVVACGGKSGNPMIGDAGVGGGPSNQDPSVTNADPEDKSVPHALGTISLAEIHQAGESDSMPAVAVSFVPNVAKHVACTKQIEGCDVALVPHCAQSCGSGEVCLFDDSCHATCQKTPACTTACKKDEVCSLDSKDSSKSRCTKRETFDAGPIAFTGTSMPISMYPPYAFEADEPGAPFVGGAELKVKAQGAIDAGFESFEETFTATTFIQTKPALDKLTKASVFGTGTLDVGWVAGKDAVRITVSTEYGSATCVAKDASGSFSIPRAVIDAVRQSPTGEDKSGDVNLTVARERTELRKDKKTKGSLASTKVESVGWLALVTSSIESTSFSGCSGKLIACGDECIDTTSDRSNCGGCGTTCASGEACVSGKCTAGMCTSGSENTLEACTDGCSNDGDKYIDCDDYDCCPVLSNCPATTACGKP